MLTTIFIIIGLILVLTPLLVWWDFYSITHDEFQSVEDWHNFRKTLGGK